MTGESPGSTRLLAIRVVKLVARGATLAWRRLTSDPVRGAVDAPSLPSWDDPELTRQLGGLAYLDADECRELLRGVYRAVLAYERSADPRVLDRLARQVALTAQLWGRADYRDAVRRPAAPVPPEATLSVSEVLAKLTN